MDAFWKRPLALFLILSLLFLTACTKAGDGLSLSVCVGAEPRSLDPIYAEEPGDLTILNHLYENLMRITVDASGQASVSSGMAKSVDEEEETIEGGVAVTYTFRLRSARWSDGQAVKASDFVYAWQRLANPANHSPYAELLSCVSGFSEARESGDMSLLQAAAKNDSTFVVVLNGRHDWFLREVCTSPAAMPLRQDVIEKAESSLGNRSWWEDPTALVTNGPYTAVESGDTLRLEQSSRYYADISGPQSLTFHFAETAEEAQELYDSKTVDAVWPAAEDEGAWLPLLETHTVVFNCAAEPFADALIRQAFFLAIDRNALAETVGDFAKPAEGVIPSAVPGSAEGDFRTAGGPLLDNDPALYEESCNQAKALLQEAGYNSGSDLGELEYLYAQGDENTAVAEALCQQWKEILQVQITPKALSEQKLSEALQNGEYTAAALRLTAPANDAECYLSNWISGSSKNVAAYTSTAYDTLMSVIASAGDGTARMGCLHDAEELLLMDYALAPLYNNGTTWAMRETLTGAYRDPRGWFTFSGVFTRNA